MVRLYLVREGGNFETGRIGPGGTLNTLHNSFSTVSFCRLPSQVPKLSLAVAHKTSSKHVRLGISKAHQFAVDSGLWRSPAPPHSIQGTGVAFAPRIIGVLLEVSD